VGASVREARCGRLVRTLGLQPTPGLQPLRGRLAVARVAAARACASGRCQRLVRGRGGWLVAGREHAPPSPPPLTPHLTTRTPRLPPSPPLPPTPTRGRAGAHPQARGRRAHVQRQAHRHRRRRVEYAASVMALSALSTHYSNCSFCLYTHLRWDLWLCPPRARPRLHTAHSTSPAAARTPGTATGRGTDRPQRAPRRPGACRVAAGGRSRVRV